jgi:ABC-type multidrug transport system fused ATPase/permease subunit
LVSIRRLIQFFDADELKPYVTESRSGDVAICLDNVSLGWTLEQELQGMEMLRANISINPDKEKANTKAKASYSKVPPSDQPQPDDTLPDLEAGHTSINRSVESLRNITATIKKGELVAVVGPVGCGKSSFLSGILGEMNPLSGSLSVSGSIAYCDQRPWILNDTIQGNILFGREYQDAPFDAALYAACLEDDIAILPGGLQTQIGEKGINLSGGQKARVALARAVYRDADIYLLDDPLSAVDAHVAQFLFHECVCRALAGKTRILVTHHVHLLPHVDKVIVLEDGQVKAIGTYAEIQQAVDIAQIATQLAKQEAGAADKVAGGKGGADSEPEEEGKEVDDVATSADESKLQLASEEEGGDVREVTVQVEGAKMRSRILSNHVDDMQYAELRLKSVEAAKWRKTDNRATLLMTKEEKKEGDVSLSVYLYYIQSGGWGLFIIFLCTIIANQAFNILGAYWLQHWGTVAANREKDDEPLSSSRNIWYLNIYAALASISLFFYVLRSLVLANHRLGTSVELHNGLLTGTLASPVAFFDTTPIGRILNRFSSDLLTIDEELSQTISQMSNAMASVLGAIGAIAGATKGTFLILMVPLIYFYFLIQKFFRATNTSIARLESMSRSPIYADFSQALTGVSSIRAYGEQTRFINNLESAVNANSTANLTQQLASQWLAIRLDFLGSCISFFIAVIAASTTGFIPAGFVALGLSYSFQMTTYLKFLVRMVATGEAQMNSVERVMFYMNHIDQEAQVTPPTLHYTALH